MRLVFITRKLDRSDSRTGFVFDWILKLARHMERLYVICQEQGNVSGLPDNIEVHSLGKEKGRGKIRQAVTLCILSFQLSKNTSGFFCHMMPVYVIAAWPANFLFRKKLLLWYVHKSVDWKLRLATAMADKVLTASEESFRLASRKVKVVGHGIDVKKFEIRNSKFETNPKFQTPKFKIISIGRISPVKDYETLLKATEILVNQKGVKNIQVEIYGEPALPADRSYLASLQLFVKNARLQDYFTFKGGISYAEVPEALSRADAAVNMSQTGSLDKFVLEAAAAGTIVLTSNEAFEKPLMAISRVLFFVRNDPAGLAEKILLIKQMEPEKITDLANSLRTWVARDHNLDILVEKIINEFKRK